MVNRYQNNKCSKTVSLTRIETWVDKSHRLSEKSCNYILS